jgi:hypothetical protein
LKVKAGKIETLAHNFVRQITLALKGIYNFTIENISIYLKLRLSEGDQEGILPNFRGE